MARRNEKLARLLDAIGDLKLGDFNDHADAERELMTDLRWVKPPKMHQQLAHAPVPNGSLIAIEGTGYSKNAPDAVKVLRAYTPFIKAIRAMASMPEYADLNDTISVHRLKGTSGSIRSKSFPLTARGFLHTQRWVCQDPTGTVSPQLRTCRFVDVSIQETAPQVRGIKLLSIRARVSSPKDPIIDLSIVAPNHPHELCSFSDVLESHTKEALLDSQRSTVEARSIVTPQDIFHNEMDNYDSEPSRWQAWASPSQLTLDAEEQAEIEIHVIPGAPGRFPLAVVAAENTSEQFSVSNIVVVNQHTDGSFKVLFGDASHKVGQPGSESSPRSRYRLQVEADVFNEDKGSMKSRRQLN